MKKALIIFTCWQEPLQFLHLKIINLLKDRRSQHANNYSNNIILQLKPCLKQRTCKVQKGLQRVWDFNNYVDVSFNLNVLIINKMVDNELDRVSAFLKMNKLNENSCLRKCAIFTLYMLLLAGLTFLTY